MKKLGKLLITLLLAVVSLTAVFAVTACTTKPSGTEYSIVFRDKDGEELKTVTVKKGVVPEYTDELPALPANTAEFTYSWKWDKEFVAATSDATYKLVLDSVKNKYEIKFISDGEQVGETQTVEYGTAATAPADPTKAPTEVNSYTFDGWYTAEEGGDAVADFTVTGNATYYAHFTPGVRKYAIVFKFGETVVASYELAHGATVTIPDAPNRDAVDKVYTFDGWYTAEEGGEKVTAISVSGDAAYYARYTYVTRKYTVNFKNGEEVLQSTEVEYGTTPEYKGETPTKQATAQFTYTFKGWDKEIAAVTGDVTYTATFDGKVNKYTVNFKNGEEVLQSTEVEYGTTPEYKGETPVKTGDAQYSYTFKCWDKEIAAVTGDVTYTATFDKKVNKYTVTFKNGEEVLQSTEVEYGTTPEYKGETPTMQATAQFTYTFKGWDKEIVAVTGDVTYAATFNQTVNQYAITLKNGETVLKTLTLDYGSTVEVPEDVKVEGYEILGWEPEFETVTEDAEYAAIVARILKQADKDNFAKIIGANPDGNYILGEDIDFANGSTGFVLTFGGMLDGRGHKLKNIKLGLANAKPDADDWVYAFIGENAGTIKNIGFYYTIPDANGNFRASMVRSNSGLMGNIYVKINVNAAPHETGALAGQNTSYGVIKNVIANWSGTANANAGPIVGGELGGTIKNAYAIRNGVFVSGNNNYSNPYNAAVDKEGVLIGTYENCKNYDDMAALVAELDLTAAGWSSYWSVKDGKVIFGEEDPEPVDNTVILTQENMANFAKILAENPNGKYALGSDIDFGGNSIGQIGTFSGELDGRGFALKNFTLTNNSNTDPQWSIAFIAENTGTIKNVALEFSYSGNNGKEGFVAKNSGNMNNIFASVRIDQKSWACSGIIGINAGSGKVMNVVVVLTKGASVSAGGIGAIVGADYNSTIKHCYGVCGDVIPADQEAFASPYHDTWKNGSYAGNKNYTTLEELVAEATFAEADGWNQEYFAKTFKAIADLKNA